jgi:hypothetical protein
MKNMKNMMNMKNFKPVLYTNEIQSFVYRTKLNPMWISGFVAGEGCFSISMGNKSLFSVAF